MIREMAVEQVCENIYRIGVPLPGRSAVQAACYLVRSAAGARHLLVDTAPLGDAWEHETRDALASLGVRMEDTDIFLTDRSPAHSGLCDRLRTPATRVYCGAGGTFTATAAWLKTLGAPAEQHLAPHAFSVYAQEDTLPTDCIAVQDGARFEAGGYHWEAVDLAGHTSDLIGLWAREPGILLCGDHILASITPHIGVWGDGNDALGIYLRNLRKVRTMHIRRLMPAHGPLVENVDARIEQLLAHHARRCDSICTLLDEWGEGTVWQLAHALHWDCDAEVLNAQLPLALLETSAHLEHLCRMEKLACDMRGGVSFYRVQH